jgi:hypothetical protein
MKTVRRFALAGFLFGIFFISGTSTPHAAGQPLATPAAVPRPPVDPAAGPALEAPAREAPNPFGRQNYFMPTMMGSGVGMTPAISVQLARQYAKAIKEEDKKDIRKKLSDTLSKEFEQLAQQQQNELDVLEKQVANLKTILKKRKDSKDTIVDRRLEQLIQEAEGLGWGSPSPPRPSEYAPQPK